MNSKALLFSSSVVFSILGCNLRESNSSVKHTAADLKNESIVLVAASDSVIDVAVFEEKGKLIEKGDHFCAARSNGMGGVFGWIRTDEKIRCFRTKDALLAFSESGQRLNCNRAENTHDGLVTRCSVWEAFNRGGLIDAQVQGVRGETCRVKFKAKPHTEPLFCDVLYEATSVIATYGCYPSLDALKKYGKLEPSAKLKRAELRCKSDAPYVPNKMYSTLDCQFKLIP